jgi:predicted ATP-dependent endonuclease of OLD family
MPFITEIHLDNYRSHKSTVIKGLGKLVGFIGENDCGKSNIFRFLETTLNGESFPETHLFGDKVKGTRSKSGGGKIVFSNGLEVERRREGSKQYIKLSTEPEPFKTVAEASKGPVAEATGFKRVVLGAGKDSRAESLQIVPLEDTAPFLIMGLSDASVLQKVNGLASGAKIERAKKELESELKSLKTGDYVVAHAMLAKAVQLLEIVEDTRWDELQELSRGIHEALRKLDEANARELSIKLTQDSLDSVKRVLRLKAQVLLNQQTFDHAFDAVDTLTQAKRRLDDLRYVQQTLGPAVATLELSLRTTDIDKALAEYTTAVERYSVTTERYEALVELNRTIIESRKTLVKLYQSADSLEIDLEEVGKELAKHTCEVCGALKE